MVAISRRIPSDHVYDAALVKNPGDPELGRGRVGWVTETESFNPARSPPAGPNSSYPSSSSPGAVAYALSSLTSALVLRDGANDPLLVSI